MTKKATVELYIQENKIRRTFCVSNVRDWDAILSQAFLITLNVIIDVKHNKVSIQPTRKPKQHRHMLQKQSHAVSTAACSMYQYDNEIPNDSSSHAPEIDIEDEKAEFPRYHDVSVAHILCCIYCFHE